ncbi:MAG TPA: MOSC domain-containing protein [Bryobacteraceae bacterium]|nr:MOSC domain-containing protein [Bryobacteraceae bacterium]
MPGILTHINRSNGGLPKLVVSAPVVLTPEGLEGDRHRNLKYHGGPDKAVLMLAAEHLEYLKQKGFAVFPGALGENLTVSGLDPARWRSGQRYRLGDDPIIELTTLRVPCLNLDVYDPAIKTELYDAACKAGNPDSPNWARGGFYARVIRAGLLVPGAPVTLESEMA